MQNSMAKTQVCPSMTGGSVYIRPIRITDQQMEAEFVRRLSPEAKHFRFLGGVRELSAADVKRLCEVDGRHSMAFVATVDEDGVETEIGVSRYGPNSDEHTREMAVSVADAWQKKGLSKLLTEKLIEFARGYGVRRLYSTDFAENLAMRSLAKELGMTARRDPDDARQVIYSLSL